MEEIVKICIAFLEHRKGVKFIENIGTSTICIYKNEEYFWNFDSPWKLSHKFRFKSKNFFNEIKKLKTFKNAYKEKCRLDLEYLLEKDDKELYDIIINKPIISRNDVKDAVKTFYESKDILKIQSPMATQKTNLVYELIEQSKATHNRFLMISPRRSLAQECYSKYKKYNFKYYEHYDYDINDNLIVQFDSLWKYDINAFDVIIIDEITSLLLYISDHYDGKEKKYKENIEKFLNIQSKIVLIDSFIIHNPFKGSEISILNEFRENLEVIEYINKHTFISEIVKKSRKECISISSNEKRMLYKLQKLIEKHNRKCLVITGDTPNRDKILKDLENIKDLKDYGYDCILYSPVITVGISFFFNIENHFHFDNSRSIDPVNSIQMIRRIRNAKKIHYFIQGAESYKTVDEKKIERYEILDLFKMYNIKGMYLGLTEVGQKMIKILKIKNIFMNTHKYAFRELLKYQFKVVKNNNFEMDSFKV